MTADTLTLDRSEPLDQNPAPAPRRPNFNRFRKAVRMPAEEARRQSQVVQTAWTVFGERSTAMTFLNTHHEELGARPLELAMASDDGLEAVERVLHERGSERG